MSSLAYLIPRLVRHFMPENLTRFLLLRGMIIRPGMETSDPLGAVERYKSALQEFGVTLAGKRILVLGYGGRFAIGCALLKAGAEHVVLCEYKVKPDHSFNKTLVTQYESFLALRNGRVEVNPDLLTLVEGDIRKVVRENRVAPVDIVLSNSVYEHLADVEGITLALAKAGKPDSAALHFVDLRDHFFKYPFEMLRFSAKTWYRWLNPTSHHNRLRVWDYRKAFAQAYADVDIDILATDIQAYQHIEPFVQPEFKQGSLEENAVTHIRVFARRPLNRE
jgi:hypothetical protein